MALGLTPGPDLDWHGAAARERDTGQVPAPAGLCCSHVGPPVSTARAAHRQQALLMIPRHTRPLDGLRLSGLVSQAWDARLCTK